MWGVPLEERHAPLPHLDDVSSRYFPAYDHVHACTTGYSGRHVRDRADLQ